MTCVSWPTRLICSALQVQHTRWATEHIYYLRKAIHMEQLCIMQPRLIGNRCLYYFCNTVIMYLAACFAAVSKWNVQRVALKHRFNTWPWQVFIRLVQATYCSVFIMLLEVRFAAIHNSNIQWVSLKIKLYEVGSIPYTKPKPKPTLKC